MQSLNAVPRVSSLAIWESQFGEDAVLECSTSSFLSSQLVAPVDPANVPGLSVSNAVYVVPFSEPRNRSWITKVHASSWRTWRSGKISHHQQGDYEFFRFAMHTNILHLFFAPNCGF